MAEGQGSQVQVRPPCPPPAERDSTHEAKLGPGRDKHRALKRYQRHKQGATTANTWGAPATGGDHTMTEAEGVAPGGSGLSLIIRPPPNTYPVDSKPRMPTGPQAMWDPVEPSPGPPLTEEASTGEEELVRKSCAAERWWPPPQRGGRRVQPIFRIIYTALGEPQEGSTLEPLLK